ALVALPLQDDGAAVAQVGGEPLEQRALAHAGVAVDVGDARLAAADGVERVMERLQLAIATDQRQLRERLDYRGGARAAAGLRAEALEQLVVAGPLRGLAREHARAQLVEVGGDRRL